METVVPKPRKPLLVIALIASCGLLLLSTPLALVGLIMFPAFIIEPPKPVVDWKWNGGMVDRPGTYHHTPTGNILTMLVDGHGIVHYKLVDKNDRVLLANGDVPSAYHRFWVYYVGTDKLWFHSSDLGGWLYQQQPDGSFVCLEPTYEAKQLLPDDLQDQWRDDH